MSSRDHIDQTYHGTINPDDEPSISKLDNLGLHGLSIRGAQSVVATDRNHVTMNGVDEDDPLCPIPQPFKKTEADSLWISMQEQYRQQRLKPYLSSSG